jgi:hypothetical protein
VQRNTLKVSLLADTRARIIDDRSDKTCVGTVERTNDDFGVGEASGDEHASDPEIS